MTTAQLLVSVDGGIPATGGQSTANTAAAITMSAVSKDGWGNPAALWQIYGFPAGYAAPAGWSTVATVIQSVSCTVYQFSGNIDPPAFALPGGAWWGKLLFRLVVLGTIVDELCGVSVASSNGVLDTAFLEAGQFDPARHVAGALQTDVRQFDSALTAITALTTATSFFSLDVTLVGGTATIASGKNLTNAVLVSVRLKTPLTATGMPVVTFVAGMNGNVSVTSYNASAGVATTDVSTYTVVFAGAV